MALLNLLKELNLNYTSDDITNINNNITLLQEHGLDKLNKRLLEQNKKMQFIHALTEHNFASNLLKELPDTSSLKIDYEPNDTGAASPPDLRISLENTTYLIQIKCLSKLKHENQKNEIFNSIEKNINSIKTNKFVNLEIANDFQKDNISKLIEMLREIAPSANDNTEYEFTIEAGNTLAVISFTTPTDTTLQNLTLGIFGDLGVSDITGLDKGQIKSAFKKKSGQRFPGTNNT